MVGAICRTIERTSGMRRTRWYAPIASRRGAASPDTCASANRGSDEADVPEPTRRRRVRVNSAGVNRRRLGMTCPERSACACNVAFERQPPASNPRCGVGADGMAVRRRQGEDSPPPEHPSGLADDGIRVGDVLQHRLAHNRRAARRPQWQVLGVRAQTTGRSIPCSAARLRARTSQRRPASTPTTEYPEHASATPNGAVPHPRSSSVPVVGIGASSSFQVCSGGLRPIGRGQHAVREAGHLLGRHLGVPFDSTTHRARRTNVRRLRPASVVAAVDVFGSTQVGITEQAQVGDADGDRKSTPQPVQSQRRAHGIVQRARGRTDRRRQAPPTRVRSAHARSVRAVGGRSLIVRDQIALPLADGPGERRAGERTPRGRGDRRRRRALPARDGRAAG